MIERRKHTFTEEDGITLKEFMLQRCCLCEKVANERAMAQEQALKLAKENLAFKLEEMNNFRRDMQKMEGQFMTKEAYESKHELLQIQVNNLRLGEAELKGKASASSVYVAWGISIIGLLLALIGLIHSYMK